MDKAAKITSFPENTVWERTRNGKFVSRDVTSEDKKRRKDFCKQRGWICARGCGK